MNAQEFNPEQYQQGYMLRRLAEYLKEKLGKGICKKMSTEMGATELQLTTKNMGTSGQGMNIMVMQYDCNITFEDFPFYKFDPAVLYALVGTWLMEHDDTRDDFDLPDPDVEIVVEDNDTAEIDFSIEFREPIMVVEDPNGLIEYRGKKYKIAPYEIWLAENFEQETSVKG